MKALVIFNPQAGSGSAELGLKQVESALVSGGVAYDLLVVASFGQARRAAETAQGYDAVIAAGGDGTVSGVVNGLMAAAGDGPTLPLGVLPLGTGNDFSDMAGIPRQLDRAVRLIARGNYHAIDAGWVTYCGTNGNRPEPWHGHFFNNNCAVAMEPVVTLETDRITRIKGSKRYLLGVLRGLIKLKAWQMRVSWDGGEFEGAIFLMSVANTPRTGGHFHVAPGAAMDDGLLDFVIVPELPRRQVLALLPRLLNGSHVRHPRVLTGRTRQLAIHCQPGTPIHADGEIIARRATDIHYQVLPGKLTLIG